MSGAEALGVIASATQLAAYSIKIVLHLSELYTEVRGAPCRTKEQIIQVRELIETTTLIEQHKSLRSPAINAQLQTTLDEARSLYNKLRDLSSRYTTNPLFRYWAIAKGASTKEIHARLEKLDRHKSTLKLCISLVHTDLLANIEGRIRSMSTSNQSPPTSRVAATQVAAITNSQLVRKIGNEVLPVNVMPENRLENTPQADTPVAKKPVPQQSAFQFHGQVTNSGTHSGHFSQITGDVTNNYGEEKNSPFGQLQEQERNHKLHEFAFAGKKSALSALLQVKVDVEYRGPNGNTPLHRTIPGHHTQSAALLIKHGADVDAQGAHNATPLMLCAQHGDHETAGMLLEDGAHTEMKNSLGETALLIASRDRQWLVVKHLLANRANVQVADDRGWTALILAADRGHVFIVEELLSFNPELEAKTREGWTALMRASDNGHDVVVDMLLKQRAHAQAETDHGWTALMVAAGKGHEKVVRILLQHEPGINKAGKNGGNTALMWAAMNGHMPVFDLIIEQGADQRMRNKSGLTAADMVKQRGN